ncbi:hypothetical protein FJTKL_11975 [Diaporthe vaccinii]|uniref:PABC domain-containing protein n=1 Tax=Diaporthe vaccinii TaxID=105482 RepID=A0ABR4FAQ8_9PEZI
MFSIRDRDELGEILFQQVSRLEPELAEILTDAILAMEDNDIIRLIGDPDALQAQVQRTLDDFVHDLSEDERILTPSSSSDRSRWSPTAESITQRAAVIADSEDIEDPRRTYGFKTSAELWRAMDNEDPQVMTYDGSTPIPAMSEVMKEIAGKNSTQSRHEATEFVETIRRPAELNAMKELARISAAVEALKTQVEDYESCNSLASTSTASYALGGNGQTVPPVDPAPKKKGGKRVSKIPRASRRDAAADHTHPAVEKEAPASMPLMEAVRQDRAQMAQRPPRRTTRPVNTSVRDQEVEDTFADGAVCGFVAGLGVTICCVLIFW